MEILLEDVIYVQRKTVFSTYHDHGLRSVQERSLLLNHKPGINYLLTFETLPHTRLLNTILKRFYSILRTEIRHRHTVLLSFIVIF